jgi:hypothetical protein
MKGTTKMDESLMIGLKKKLEAAESEIESLKRKRADQRWEIMKVFLIVDFCSLVMKHLFLNGDF